MTKKEIIEYIFKQCIKRKNMTFNNDYVKSCMKKLGSSNNPYDMTKLDDISKFPDLMLKKNYFIVHKGKGEHQFVKEIEKVYHKFEIIEKNETIDWVYRPSILNDYSTSENSVLSLCYNHRIIHDFLYNDIVSNPKIYNSERKNKVSFNYKIGELDLSYEQLQIEIDLTMEHNRNVTVFEGKNTKNSNSWLINFNVFQLYNPFRYYYNLREANKLNVENITAAYLVRQKKDDGSYIRLYNYEFTDPYDITSIIVKKKREYRLKRRGFDD
ncbi:MAG: hypothetical protein ISS16_01140 [Ignavibacteria bacterium]|nr:hypothetical protein [Ignavibacteria bacterium]